MPSASSSWKIYVGPVAYPHTTAALQAAGARLVDSLAEATGFVYTQWPGHPFPAQLPEQVKWVQVPMVGVDSLVASGQLDGSRRWSNGKGVYGRQVAEAAFALLVGVLHHRLHPARRSLSGCTVGIVGFGAIGQALATMLQACGASVIALTRTGESSPHPAVVRTVAAADRLAVLPACDHVVLCCPLTPATRGMFAAAEFAAMKNTAVLVNVARGPVVDTAALTAALQAGQLAGAGLDVTDPEPLPDDHPLWQDPRVLITPHTANTMASIDELVAPLVAKNYQLLVAGQRMLTEIDPQQGY